MIEHVFRRAGRSLWENVYLNVVATGVIASALLLLGVFLTIEYNLSSIIDSWDRDVHVSAYFEPQITESARFAARDRIAAMPGVQEVRYVSEADAPKHIAGYCVVNDVSEREYQMERGGQWTKGKSADTFCPTGPWLVTADEIPDPGKLQLWTEVNGERRQDSNTADLIFGIEHIVSYVSHFMTLNPGDVIPTGTPSGVAMGFKPPKFLRPGDRVRLGVEGLGEQNQRMVAWQG